jgi:hypothetical protein
LLIFKKPKATPVGLYNIDVLEYLPVENYELGGKERSYSYSKFTILLSVVDGTPTCAQSSEQGLILYTDPVNDLVYYYTEPALQENVLFWTSAHGSCSAADISYAVSIVPTGSTTDTSFISFNQVK